MNEKNISEILIQLIDTKMTKAELEEQLGDFHANDIAAALAEMTPDQRMKVYRALNHEDLGDVFAYVDEDVEVYIDELSNKNAAGVISSMDADDAADTLEQLDDDKRKKLESMLDKETREDIKLIDSYDDELIGSRMTTNMITIAENLTVKQAMRALVRQAADNDNISTLYVVDKGDKFCGAIDLKDLIIAREGTDLDSLVVTSYPFVYADERIDEKLEEIKDYSEDSIPVLDRDGSILGVITSQDLVEMTDDELQEDYAKLAGLTTHEDLDEPVKKSIIKRLPWLAVLLVLELVISTVVGAFEGIIATLTLVVCFQSLILGMAGNTGTQSLAVTIRVISEEDLTFTEKLRLIAKEVRVGLSNGAILGTLAFGAIGLYIWLLKGEALVFSFATSGCIGLALVIAMTVSSALGTVIPLTFKKLGLDPAAASGPLITTLNDLVAVVIYYSFAWLMLMQVMGIGG